MKVYVLSQEAAHTKNKVILGVFTSPKKTRKWFDNWVSVDSRKRWTKRDDGSRVFVFHTYIYVIEEHVMDNAE